MAEETTGRYRSLIQEQQFHTKEWDANCRQLIADHFAWLEREAGGICRPPCVFGDLVDCMPAGTIDPEDPFMVKFHKVNWSCVYRRQHCFTHNRLCNLFGDPSTDADIETAGLPCPDYSMAGLRQLEEGPTIGAFLAHAKRHIEKKTRIICIENTKAPNIYNKIKAVATNCAKTDACCLFNPCSTASFCFPTGPANQNDQAPVWWALPHLDSASGACGCRARRGQQGEALPNTQPSRTNRANLLPSTTL